MTPPAILSRAYNPNFSRKHLQNHIDALELWLQDWKIKINVEKSNAVLFRKKTTKQKPDPPPVKLFDTPVPWLDEAKYLGVILDKRLTWKAHFQSIQNKFRKAKAMLYPLLGKRSPLSVKNKLLMYKVLLRPIITYAAPVWGAAAKSTIEAFERLQSNIIRTCHQCQMVCSIRGCLLCPKHHHAPRIYWKNCT